MTQIRSAAVVGAGTMGAQIAAHLANAGVPVRLLDLTADAARQGLDRLKTLRPDPWFAPDVRSLVQPAGLDALAQIAGVDWIIEAVVEDLAVKRDLLARASGLAPQAIVSSNTSGIPIAAIAEGLPAASRPRLVGTHFFNPPRYLQLVELIPTRDTDPAIVGRLSRFPDHRLGKGVVVAKDTPGFIANRIGVFGACRALALVALREATVEEIDALTGPAIGRPKSATFRTMDIAGLDVFSTVARDLATRLPAEAAAFALPPFVNGMLARGMTGEKAGAASTRARPVRKARRACSRSIRRRSNIATARKDRGAAPTPVDRPRLARRCARASWPAIVPATC